MKKLFLFFVGLNTLGVSACSNAEGNSSAALKAQSLNTAVLASPLIIGASQSADYLNESPGKVLARRAGTINHVTRIAQSGSTGVNVLNKVSETDWSAASLVIGHDLFFWDSAQQSCDASLNAVDRLFDKTESIALPVLVGNIPRISIVPAQPCIDALNQKIESRCSQDSKCRLLDLKKTYVVLRDEGLTVDGRSYGIRELLPDGLHLSSVAANYLADLMQKLIADL